MPKKYLLISLGIIIIFILIVAGYFLVFKKSKTPQNQTPEERKQDIESKYPQFKNLYGNEEILKNALNLYLEKKQAGIDMASGPCIGKASDDWVVDIANDPRQPLDDKEENQCPDYINGTAHHFIELSPKGKILRSE